MSTRVATIGLVAVLGVLTAFAGTTALVIAQAGAEAERSAVVRELSSEVQEGLLELEELADEAVAEPSPEAEQAYETASRALAGALDTLGESYEPGEEVGREQVSADYATYRQAVQELFETAESDPDEAEDFEELSVDPPYERVQASVAREDDRHERLASDAFASLGRFQHILVPATPVVFGLGLIPLFIFGAALRGHRREIEGQVEENRHLALHDPLTGLPNRTLLRQRADIALADAQRDGHTVAMLLIDLDRFKEINDTLGHHYGDLVLQAVASRLRGSLRATDTVARLGGDEFAVLLTSVADVDAAMEVAAKLRTALEHSIETAEGVWLDVEASIGVVIGGLHGNDIATLMQHADIAMYVAKERGLGACVYDADLNSHSLERLKLLGELRRAIDNGELVLHYQPKVTMATGQVCGVEALVRWNHPQRGMVPPDAFIPLAEHTGLIRSLTQYVVDAALAQCKQWQAAGRTMQVAVNVSARNLLDDRFVADMMELIDKWQVAPSCLELEVTESAIMADPVRARATLARLSSLGFHLAIDDFGAGYTSLAHLKDLPVHQLKIDRSFISQMSLDTSDALIVRSVVELGHNLGLRTVAEGIEDQSTWDQLAALGCDEAQGFFLVRPLPVEQLEAWFEEPTRVRALTHTAPMADTPVGLV